MTTDREIRLWITKDGHVEVHPDDRLTFEPICPECGTPVRWVLDMYSLTVATEGRSHTIAHARCVWLPVAFTRERMRAKRRSAEIENLPEEHA